MSQEAISSEQYLEVVQTLHNLTREAVALEKLVAAKLAGRSRSDSDTAATTMEFIRDETLLSILRRRLLAEGLSLDDAINTIQTACCGLDRFRCQVQNLLGSVAQQVEIRPAHDRLDIKSIIHSVTELLEGAAQEKGIKLTFDHDEDGIIFGDQNLLFRALFNILDNAIKYSYPLTEQAKERFIGIDSRRHTIRRDWSIVVRSYGVGIDKDEIDSGTIFKYGSRGRRADDRGRFGTGVGLAEARRIILAHHGEIRIESKPLEAAFVTTVRIIIPG